MRLGRSASPVPPPDQAVVRLDARVAALEQHFAELIRRLANHGGIVFDRDPSDLPPWQPRRDTQ